MQGLNKFDPACLLLWCSFSNQV